MKKKVVVCMAVLGLGLLALAGCGKKEASADAKELNVQFVPTNNDGSMEAKAKPFAQYLSEKLGCKVNVTLATDYCNDILIYSQIILVNTAVLIYTKKKRR